MINFDQEHQHNDEYDWCVEIGNIESGSKAANVGVCEHNRYDQSRGQLHTQTLN